MGVTDSAKWRAIYDDNTYLLESDENGEHGFKEIDLKKIKAFQLINERGIPICQVHLGEGKRLIFARRNLLTTGQLFKETENGVKIPIPTRTHQRIIILGWQKTVKGINTKAIFYLLPDGRIEMDDQWREDSIHSKVNTPGLLPELEKKSEPKSEGDNVKGTGYSDSNDSAFEGKK